MTSQGNWARLQGLTASPEWNGMHGRVLGARHGHLLLSVNGVDVVVPEGKATKCRGATVPLPPSLSFDPATFRTIPVPKKEVAFRDTDGDSIRFVVYATGVGQYAVQGTWRPPFTSIEFFPSGRKSHPSPHFRVDCGDCYKVVAVPDPATLDTLRGHCEWATVPHAHQSLKAGDPVTIESDIHFADSGTVAKGTKAVVLARSETSPDAEVAIASGDRFDVPCTALRRAPLKEGDGVELTSGMKFRSGKAVGPGFGTVTKAEGDDRGRSEVKVNGVTFDAPWSYLARRGHLLL